MYHIVYLTTNKVNLKIYIGVHSTNNINDAYLGSGLALRRAIKKYGIENFEKKILFYCFEPEQAFELETNIVDSSFLQRKDTYNMAPGGKGGDVARRKGTFKMSQEQKDKISNTLTGVKKNITQEGSKRKKENMKNNNPMHNLTNEENEIRKQKISRKTKANWENPEFRSKCEQSAQSRDKSYLTEEWRANFSKKRKENVSDLVRETSSKIGKLRRKSWLLRNSLGQEFIIDDLTQFCEELGINRHTFRKYGLGQHKTKKFWTIKMIE